MKNKTWIICLFLFILSFVLRLYRIDNPIADWHSWRQADTAAVTRNFIKEGFTPFFPKFDSYLALNGMSDQNPNRYFLAEFPIYNILVYPLYKIFGVNEIYHRLVTVIISSLTTVILYLLVKKHSSSKAAFFSALFFATLPYSIYYGRVTMPDPLHLLFTTMAFYYLALWLQKEKLSYCLLSGLFTAGFLLTKPYGLVLGLPIIYLLIRKYRIKTFINKRVFIYGLISLAPFLLWRYHINQHPEGQFGVDWLYNSTQIRFTPAFFRWIIFERMNKVIFSIGGFVLFFIGLIRGWSRKEGIFYHLWLLAIFIFISIIATGNVTHDYYQLPLLLVGCVFIGLGSDFVFNLAKSWDQKIFNYLILIILYGMSLAFAWYEIGGYFNVNHWEIVHAGQAVDRLLPKDAKVIAPYFKDSAFLYQTNRYGWTVGDRDSVEKFIEQGATHLVSVNFDDDTNYWKEKCQVVEETDRYVIIDLKKCESQQSQTLLTNPTLDDVMM